MAQQAATADSVIRYQEVEINKGVKAQIASDSLLDIRTKELISERKESGNWKGAYDTQYKITEIEKKQKRKWVLIAISAFLVSAIELLALVVQ